VEEKDGKLWMGSVLMPFVGVYNLAWGRTLFATNGYPHK
jgi:hypothetical protein